MLKGCQRRVIHLTSTDSTLFDEAYFILKEKQPPVTPPKKDMIKEAKRLILCCASKEEIEKTAAKLRKRRDGLFFAMGGVIGAILCLFCLLSI